MTTDKNLQFITNRILDTKLAIFHCLSNSVLRLPTCVVNTYKVDDNGCVYFFMHKPRQLVSQFEQEFPVGVNYFKKGNNYSLHIIGKARIIIDPEELISHNLTEEEMENALNKQLLVCVKILKVDYFDHDKKNSLLQRVKAFIYELFDYAEPDARSFDFKPAPGIHHYGF